jgi:hypothetical protein
MEVEVFLTYRGQQQIYVNGDSHLNSCGYFLPKAWKPSPKIYMYLSVGIGPVPIQPAKTIRQVVDLRRHNDLSETPGKYEVEIQCYMAGSYVADGSKLLHVSKRVKVPIVIVAPPK